MMIRFLHLLAMNCIEAFHSSSPALLTAKINHSITNYLNFEKLIHKLSFVKSGGNDQEKVDGHIKMDEIYQTFQGNLKQVI